MTLFSNQQMAFFAKIQSIVSLRFYSETVIIFWRIVTVEKEEFQITFVEL